MAFKLVERIYDVRAFLPRFYTITALDILWITRSA